MKITIDRNGDGVHVEVEREPMPESRFRALCTMLLAAIAGGVLLGAIRMIGAWAVAWSVGALALVGMYRILSKFG